MSSVSLGGLRTGLNNYYWFQKAVIKIDSDQGGVTEIRIAKGDMVKELRQWKDKTGKHRSVFVPGKGYKEWCNQKLITSEKYNSRYPVPGRCFAVQKRTL